MSLPQLLQRADIWRGGDAPAVAGISSGFVALDALLPGGGFPLGALTEILTPRVGVGELRLLLPTLARLSRERWIAFIAPPYIPYAPALVRAGIDLSHVLVVHARERADVLWSVEQALRAGTCGAVLAWPGISRTQGERNTDFKWLRRLQLAAEAGNAMGAMFMSSRAVTNVSPAALRLAVEPQADGVAVRILKRRGGWPAGPVHIDWSVLRQGRRIRRAPVKEAMRYAFSPPRTRGARNATALM
jgi:protein ImuA